MAANTSFGLFGRHPGYLPQRPHRQRLIKPDPLQLANHRVNPHPSRQELVYRCCQVIGTVTHRW